MGAVLGGTMRSRFTSIVFAFELTHDGNVFLPLLVGSVVADGFRVLTLKRSILREKVGRRGYQDALARKSCAVARLRRRNTVEIPTSLVTFSGLQIAHTMASAC